MVFAHGGVYAYAIYANSMIYLFCFFFFFSKFSSETISYFQNWIYAPRKIYFFVAGDRRERNRRKAIRSHVKFIAAKTNDLTRYNNNVCRLRSAHINRKPSIKVVYGGKFGALTFHINRYITDCEETCDYFWKQRKQIPYVSTATYTNPLTAINDLHEYNIFIFRRYGRYNNSRTLLYTYII